MPFNPFHTVTGRNALTLFDIRLDTDFIVFRGNESEASGQYLKGVLAICVPAPIKVEDIHLRLTGTQRLAWNDPRVTPTGLSSAKVDRTNVFLQHQWAPFWGTPGKMSILEKGNYEFPFELLLNGDTCESVEGLNEASVTYKLKATIGRGKLAYDLHAYKHVRVVRTLESSALEFLHAMSVENIWPNKIEYSIVVPQKAIAFGGAIPLECRFTPLLKGLELGNITVRLLEIHDIVTTPVSGSSNSGLGIREYKTERTASNWTVKVSREEHWQNVIGDTGQEGWVVETFLNLPRKLGKCVQDVNVQGIKVRHKLKMVVALKNPDGHISELRATLPLTIFISPNMPLDEQGNMNCATNCSTSGGESASIAPPGYGEHVLDQLYDQVDINTLQTPAPMSAVHSPMYGMSRTGSSENLASINASLPVHPAALTSRLQDVSSHEASMTRRGLNSSTPTPGASPDVSSSFVPLHLHHLTHRTSHHGDSSRGDTHTARRHSGDSHDSDENSDPEHIDYPDLEELSKVPSYATAIKSRKVGDNSTLPDYQTAASQASITRSSSAASVRSHSALSMNQTTPSAVSGGPLSLIAEAPHEAPQNTAAPAAARDEAASIVSGGGGSSAAASIVSEPVSQSGSNTGDDVSVLGQQSQHTQSRLRTISHQSDQSSSGSSSRSRRPLSNGGLFHSRQAPQNGDSDESRWLHLLQVRGRVAT